MGLIASFVCVVGFLLYADIYLHSHMRKMPLLNAFGFTLIYIIAACAFGAGIWVERGLEDASRFMTGYVMEKALSVDNLLAFVMVFRYFNPPRDYEHRILHFGIFGAIILRLIFVVAGTSLLAFIGRPMEFLFALLVLLSAIKVVKGLGGEDEPPTIDYSSKWYIRLLGRMFPIVGDASEPRFFVRKILMRKEKLGNTEIVNVDFQTFATPLLLCLVAIEVTDIIFSFDSMPTVVSVSRDPLIAYSAVIFAILGLRSMYFILVALQDILSQLNKSVALILAFIAVKLGLHAVTGREYITPGITLAFVLISLTLGILASTISTKPKEGGVNT